MQTIPKCYKKKQKKTLNARPTDSLLISIFNSEEWIFNEIMRIHILVARERLKLPEESNTAIVTIISLNRSTMKKKEWKKTFRKWNVISATKRMEFWNNVSERPLNLVICIPISSLIFNSYIFFFYRSILYILFGRFFFLNKLFLSQYQIVGSQLDIYIYMAAIWWSTLSLCHFRLNFQQISTEIKRKNCIFNMHCRLNSTLRIYIPRYKIKINFITHECQLFELSAGNAVFAV